MNTDTDITRGPDQIKTMKATEKLINKKIATLNEKINTSDNVNLINKLQDELEFEYNKLDALQVRLYNKKPSRIPNGQKGQKKKKSVYEKLYNYFF